MYIDKICVFIPARYESKRLPGKPLLKINDKEILLLTYNRVKKIFDKKDIYILSSNEIIKHKLKNKIPNIVLVKGRYNNGTERSCAALKIIKKKYKAVLIISCDNPYISLLAIRKTVEVFNKIKNDILYFGSTVHKINRIKQEIKNNDIAKLVVNRNNDVLYISRNIIPNYRKNNKNLYLTHHGPVCIKTEFLKKYLIMKNTFLQLAEDNEWLKFIEYGYKLKSYGIKNIPIEINSKKDLNYYKKFKNIFR